MPDTSFIRFGRSGSTGLFQETETQSHTDGEIDEGNTEVGETSEQDFQQPEPLMPEAINSRVNYDVAPTTITKKGRPERYYLRFG